MYFQSNKTSEQFNRFTDQVDNKSWGEKENNNFNVERIMFQLDT